MTNTDIEATIDQLVQKVMNRSESLQGIRGPDSSRVEAANRNIQEIGALRGRPLYYNFIGSGVGRGPYVELQDGSVKLDLINGIGIHILGHGNPKVIRASVQGALSDVVMQGNLMPNAEYLAMHDKLVALAKRKSRLKYAWLSTCGTMANENALKISRQKKTPARMIVTFSNAFSGRSTMMAEITDNASFKVGLPSYNEVLRLPFYKAAQGAASTDKTLATLKEYVAKHENGICCFVFEPMLGEGGYRHAPREFWIPLLEFCKSKGIPIWADEIQTFCRTGNFFAYETLGIGDYIDLCTIAKTAQNGATLFTEEFKPDAGLLGGTFSGSSPSLSAGLEILNTLDTDGYMGDGGKISKIHSEFVSMLNTLNETTCKGKLTEAGGMGLMVAVTPFDGSKVKQGEILKSLYNNGLICFGCGSDPYRIRFLLPAILSAKDILVAKQIIEKSVLEMS